jgi:5-formyltetrahydrofolate cyclo-ligase
MDERGDSRWAGRNGAKAAIRDRVWSGLVEAQVNIGPVFDRIPNFVGADVAAKRLSELDEWRRARVVKCNPDPAQILVRLRALYDGKLLFSPVPCLTKGLPYLRIDPDKLAARGIDFETAATSQGFMQHGETIGFEDMPSSISASSAVWRSRGSAGARGKAPDSQISNRGSFVSSGSSAPRRRSRQRFIPPRSWPIPRWSWKAMTRPCITSRLNSS